MLYYHLQITLLLLVCKLWPWCTLWRVQRWCQTKGLLQSLKKTWLSVWRIQVQSSELGMIWFPFCCQLLVIRANPSCISFHFLQSNSHCSSIEDEQCHSSGLIRSNMGEVIINSFVSTTLIVWQPYWILNSWQLGELWLSLSELFLFYFPLGVKKKCKRNPHIYHPTSKSKMYSRVKLGVVLSCNERLQNTFLK